MPSCITKAKKMMATVGIMLQKPCMARSQNLVRDSFFRGCRAKAHGDGGHQGQEQLAPTIVRAISVPMGEHKVPQAAGNGRVVLVLQIQLGALRRVDLPVSPPGGRPSSSQLGHQPQENRGTSATAAMA